MFTRVTDIAWAAGFFEGEGCFYAHYYRPREDGSRVMRVHASLAQKDRRLLTRFQQIVGFGSICTEKQSGVSAWKTSRRGEAAKLFELLKTQLGERRTERFTALHQQEQEQIFRPKKPARAFCAQDHDLSKVGRRSDGTCAECDRAYKRQWYHEHKDH